MAFLAAPPSLTPPQAPFEAKKTIGVPFPVSPLLVPGPETPWTEPSRLSLSASASRSPPAPSMASPASPGVTGVIWGHQLQETG